MTLPSGTYIRSSGSKAADDTVTERLPFAKRRGLFVWDLEVCTVASASAHAAKLMTASHAARAATVVVLQKLIAKEAAAKLAVAAAKAKLSRDAVSAHGPRSTSHVHTLPPDHAAAVLNRRLHV